MKHQAAFIPDNISNISSASQPFQSPFPHESTEFHPDSTDNLVEEILRQRAERLNKEKKSQPNAISTAKIEQSKKESKDEHEAEQKEQEKIGQQTPAQAQKQPKQELQVGERPSNRSNDTISQSSFKEKHSQSPNHQPREDIQTHKSPANHPSNSSIESSKHQNNESVSSNSLLNRSGRINDESVRRSAQQEASEGEKSMQLNLSLSPSDKKQDKDQESSSIRQKVSSSSSKRNNKIQLEMNNLQQSIRSQHRPNVEPSNNLIQQQIGADESKIQAKSSILQEPQNLYAGKKGFYDFTPLPQKNETDRQVVKALTQHLQAIDKIQNEEFSIQKTFRKSEKNQQQPQLNLSRNEFLDANKQIRAEEFQTDYSENQRENKILQHRLQSNLQYEIGQVKEMLELTEALIAHEECRQLRKSIRDLQMKNRREKIALRAASYTKRFNFHSPIAKNNPRPIQFRTKFVISQRLASKYHQAKKKIAEEKKLQAQLQDKHQVLSDYYEMMKQRKIQAYQESLKEFEYNSTIGKYQTVKNGFFSPAKEAGGPRPEYEFSKTKRTVEMESQEVPYFQVLRYKKDINKDMILEFEVWNLSKLKKLRDSNTLISKEIQYLDQQIRDVDSKLVQMCGLRQVKSSSKDRLASPSSRYHIPPSSKSISKSPQNRIRRPATAFSSPQKLNKTNSFKDYDSPASKTSFKREEPKEQLLLIDSVQLDFSKRKAMRIFQQMDDYGISPIIEESKVIEDNPTLIKKQSKKRLQVVPKPQARSKGKNLVRTRSKEIKTETSLKVGGALKGRSGKMSEQVSPQKTVQSEYYTSMQELYPKGK